MNIDEENLNDTEYEELGSKNVREHAKSRRNQNK
jgi:hypothetical protein